MATSSNERISRQSPLTHITVAQRVMLFAVGRASQLVDCATVTAAWAEAAHSFGEPIMRNVLQWQVRLAPRGRRAFVSPGTVSILRKLAEAGVAWLFRLVATTWHFMATASVAAGERPFLPTLLDLLTTRDADCGLTPAQAACLDQRRPHIMRMIEREFGGPPPATREQLCEALAASSDMRGVLTRQIAL